ncbi:hypothetical protein pb186bvf_008048 [Paramecium bursaria]
MDFEEYAYKQIEPILIEEFQKENLKQGLTRQQFRYVVKRLANLLSTDTPEESETNHLIEQFGFDFNLNLEQFLIIQKVLQARLRER